MGAGGQDLDAWRPTSFLSFGGYFCRTERWHLSMGDRQTACLELEPSIRMSKLAGPQEASGQVALSRLEHT